MIGLLLAALPVAHPCKCGPAWPREGFPADGDEGVPLDARVLLRVSDLDDVVPSDFVLRDLSSGEDVPVTTTEVDGGDGYALFLLPEAPLAQGTEHALLERDEAERTFTTGTELAAPVEEAPSLLVESVVSERGGRWSCGPDNYVALSIAGDAAWWELEVTVNGGDASTWPVADPWTVVGDSGCFVSYPLKPGDDVAVRARGVDAAGAPGPWSAVVEEHLCACDGAGVGPGLAWLIGVGVVARRRR